VARARSLGFPISEHSGGKPLLLDGFPSIDVPVYAPPD